MHDARAVVERDVISGDDLAQALGLVRRRQRAHPPSVVEARNGQARRLGPVERLVGQPDQFRAGERPRGLDAIAEHRARQRLRHDQQLALVLVQAVVGVTLHGEGGIAGQRPGRGRPGHDARGAFVVQIEARARFRRQAELHEDAGVGHVLAVALRQLVVAEAGLAARAVGRDAVGLEEVVAFPQLLENPPAALDVVVVVGDVGVVHVGPEGDALGQFLEVAHVAPHAFAALGVEGGDAVGLDVGLGAQAELLLHLDLDGQAVRVPAGLAGHAVAAHGLVAGEEVLEHARHDVVHAGAAVGRGRALVEDEEVVGGALLDAAAEDVALAPEAQDAGFEGGEIDGGIDGVEELGHGGLPGEDAGEPRGVPPPQGRARARGTTLLPAARRALAERHHAPAHGNGGRPARAGTFRPGLLAGGPAFGRKLGRDGRAPPQRPLPPHGARWARSGTLRVSVAASGASEPALPERVNSRAPHSPVSRAAIWSADGPARSMASTA